MASLLELLGFSNSEHKKARKAYESFRKLVSKKPEKVNAEALTSQLNIFRQTGFPEIHSVYHVFGWLFSKNRINEIRFLLEGSRDGSHLAYFDEYDSNKRKDFTQPQKSNGYDTLGEFIFYKGLDNLPPESFADIAKLRGGFFTEHSLAWALDKTGFKVEIGNESPRVKELAKLWLLDQKEGSAVRRLLFKPEDSRVYANFRPNHYVIALLLDEVFRPEVVERLGEIVTREDLGELLRYSEHYDYVRKVLSYGPPQEAKDKFLDFALNTAFKGIFKDNLPLVLVEGGARIAPERAKEILGDVIESEYQVYRHDAFERTVAAVIPDVNPNKFIAEHLLKGVAASRAARRGKGKPGTELEVPVAGQVNGRAVEPKGGAQLGA